nr:RhuM family protein [uncultured Treponema sp.]
MKKKFCNFGIKLDISFTFSFEAHTATDGKNYKTNFYNLDAIIAVGYRVNSKKATQFRIWANQILKEYVIKGFVMNDDRLKEPDYTFGKDYFDEHIELDEINKASERFRGLSDATEFVFPAG